MIRTYLWKRGESHATPLAGLPESPPEGDFVMWIDLVDPTPDEEARVFERFFPVHPLTLEDVTRPRRLAGRGAHLPKVEEFPQYLFVVANPLPPAVAGENGSSRRNFSARARPQLSAVVTPTVLITHHYDALPCVDSVWAFAGRHAGCLGRGPDYLFHLILDGVVDEYAPVVESIARHLDRVESHLFKGPAKDQLAKLLKLKRRVSFLRKTLILEREVLARLTRGEFDMVEDREIVYYRNVYDHLVRYAELIENAREMVSDLLQTHLAAASNRLNEVMKLLTMFSAIVLPMSLIAGVYGMNFDVMPELKWDLGYPFALALMALTGVAGFVYFRRKGWL
jgi:magnesium transporter